MLSTEWMHKLHFMGVQRLTADALSRASVKIIAEQRMADICHMHANLMRAARF